MIGQLFKLKIPTMGNPAGAIGVVFEAYPDFDDSSKSGVQVIFPNGEYCGFSYNEQLEFFSPAGHYVDREDYVFTNIMQVSTDFQHQHWDFNKIERIAREYGANNPN